MNENSGNPLCPEALHYLEEVIGEDPPRQNAFRVLGLSVFDDVRAIRRREQMLSARRFKSSGNALGGPLPLREQATAHQVAQAVHRLRSPACRLVDELFWFWPDQALPSLARHPQQVLRRWSDQEKLPSAWQATHNLGVFYLTKAIDYESQAIVADQPLTEKQSAACIECWKRAIRRWRELQQRHAMWQQYQIRVKHFNDPRFPEAAIVAIRHALDEILLRGLFTLVIRAARSERSAQFNRCLQLLERAGFDESLRLSIGRKLLSPLAGEIQLLIESTERAVSQHPQSGTQHVRELVDKTETMIRLFDTVLPEGDMLTRAVCDEFCVALLGFQVRCTRVTDDWRDALASLRAIQPLARSQKVRDRLDENIDIVKNNLRGDLR